MSAAFRLTPQALEDLDAIWWFIAEDNPEAADSVELEILGACRRLTKYPLIGTKKQDIVDLPVRFWTLTRFSNYVIVYRPETAPLQIVAILHGKRDLKEALGKRSL